VLTLLLPTASGHPPLTLKAGSRQQGDPPQTVATCSSAEVDVGAAIVADHGRIAYAAQERGAAEQCDPKNLFRIARLCIELT
jgi:hypothetical protein